ncbi:peptidoglycan glycosyltransferase [Tetzosporium hominis]|uniref:Peptidoglycan glycosyltransferase n=1 Tax=Tetzosporium hominis TaxID=2020506 RepID=A0A264W1W9_9BACL|nr:penicillin-binding transpeptidase domain-containing protein [Tetzosporium hominis]OZS77555.1 peptidoglycan glycosyltransferase [Tetzosporium hominis]
MKKWGWGVLAVPLLVLAGCNDEVTPQERQEAYVAAWNEGDYETLYNEFVSDETKEQVDEAAFVERQVALDEALGVTEREVTFTKAPEDAQWEAAEPATFPVQIKVETVAGPVEWEKEMTWQSVETDEELTWMADWDTGFILPDLAEGDEVRVSTLPFARGEIYDRNGNALAINGTGFEVGIVPGKFTDDAQKPRLAELLGTTVEYIDKQLAQSWVKDDQFVPIDKIAQTDDVRAALLEIPGVLLQETAMREYPYGEAAAHLVGYIGPITAEQLAEREDEGYTEFDQIGRQGLESFLEERLRGQDGKRVFIDKAEEGLENVMLAEKEPVAGERIDLTIDAELQRITFASMDGEPGAAAVVDPKTGEVLTLLSSPSFDPSAFMLGMTQAQYDELANDPLNPLLNRFAASYAPGSTLKPITAAIGMEAGTLDPTEGIVIEGATWQKDDSWGDYRVTRLHPEAPNPIDLEKSLVYSDNIYYAQQALKMGRETFVEGLESFGFGEDIPFFLNLQASQVSNDGGIGSEGQLADTSFGQGQMLANILHLASSYQPFLTNGTMWQPTLLLEEDDQVVWKEGLVSEQNAAILQEGMRSMVVDGFAQAANIPNIPLAGKTGTAELKATIDAEGQENGFFVSYPVDTEEMIMAMMIEDVGDNNGSGYVAEKAAAIYKLLYE